MNIKVIVDEDEDNYRYVYFQTDNPTVGFDIGTAYDCPEDSCFGRSLPYEDEILRVIQEAYDAGTRGETLYIEIEDVSEDDA